MNSVPNQEGWVWGSSLRLEGYLIVCDEVHGVLMHTVKWQWRVRYNTENRLLHNAGTWRTLVNSRAAISCPFTTRLKQTDPTPSEYTTDPSASLIWMWCDFKFRIQWWWQVVWAEVPVSGGVRVMLEWGRGKGTCWCSWGRLWVSEGEWDEVEAGEAVGDEGGWDDKGDAAWGSIWPQHDQE